MGEGDFFFSSELISHLPNGKSGNTVGQVSSN